MLTIHVLLYTSIFLQRLIWGEVESKVSWLNTISHVKITDKGYKIQNKEVMNYEHLKMFFV